MTRTAIAAGIVWALPNTVLGLVAGLVGLAFGAHAHWRPRELAVVFHRWPWGPGGALTLGNVILHTGDTLDSACLTYAQRARRRREDPVVDSSILESSIVESPIVLADHERAHVFQYMVLGLLFLPLYLLCGGISARNRFERAADRYARTGHGWWPWA